VEEGNILSDVIFPSCFSKREFILVYVQVSAMSKVLRYGDAVKLASMLEDASHGSVILAFSAPIQFVK
jgi:hypothetical protein